MKVFSLAKWHTTDDSDGAITRYRDYLEDIRPRLPGDIQKLAGAGGDISLNDGTVTRLQVSLSDACVDIYINGKWIGDTVLGLRKFHLAYSGVTEFSSSIDPDATGSNEDGYDGYGDHGFDEFELIGDELYEHRMLFWSGITLSIRFSGFTLAYEDVPNEYEDVPKEKSHG